MVKKCPMVKHGKNIFLSEVREQLDLSSGVLFGASAVSAVYCFIAVVAGAYLFNLSLCVELEFA
jgi:hypothetical protein